MATYRLHRDRSPFHDGSVVRIGDGTTIAIARVAATLPAKVEAVAGRITLAGMRLIQQSLDMRLIQQRLKIHLARLLL